MEENVELLAYAETWDNGKPIRETIGADVPLAIDHFRYFAACARAQEGAISEIDKDTVAYHFHEPLSVLMLMELIQDLLPPGVVNVVNGSGSEIGEYLATSPRIAKVAFTGSTEVGQQIMSYAARNVVPVTLELGGKSPNIFFC